MDDGVPERVHDVPRRTPQPALVRTFYCDVLKGRQVWRTRRKSRYGQQLFFRVAGRVIETGVELRYARVKLAIPVEVAEALAERCWDRGFTVCASRDVRGRLRLSLIDPFGLAIILRPQTAVTSDAA